MRCAYNLTRREVHYRHEAFSAGLRAAGYDVRSSAPVGQPGDVLLIWNRYGQYHDIATRFEQRGGTVLVAENGYMGRDEQGVQLYALARGGHNGSGDFPVGGTERFAALGIELQPWREAGEKIVIRGQRGIGNKLMASPPDWHGLLARRLRGMTRRPIQIVPHPGNGAEADLQHQQYLLGAHALAIWSSSVGVKALVMGIPVFFDAPHWICEGAAVRGINDLEHPKMDDAARLCALQRMAWAQWTLAEISSGEPFRRLAEMAEGQRQAA